MTSKSSISLLAPMLAVTLMLATAAAWSADDKDKSDIDKRIAASGRSE
jgi:hypothetical protein